MTAPRVYVAGILTDVRGELRAGYRDARRTAAPVWWHGARLGDLAYAAGYAAGTVRR